MEYAATRKGVTEEGRQLAAVVTVVNRYWKYLPIQIQTWYTIDDMVNDAVVEVLKVRDRFDPTLCQASTFAYAVTDRWCKSKLNRERAKKRQAYLIPVFGHDVALARRIPAGWKASTTHKRNKKRVLSCHLVENLEGAKDPLAKLVTQLSVPRTVLAALEAALAGYRPTRMQKKEIQLWNKRLNGALAAYLAPQFA